MSSCWEEARIEKAAMRLTSLGAKAAPRDADLEAFLRHAETCVRCGELLDLHMETETRILAAQSSAEAERKGGVRVIPLRDVSSRSAARPQPRANDTGSFALAADSGRPSGQERARESRGRSLESGDGIYRVRLLPNEAGEGAVAVLVASGAESGTPGRTAIGIGDDEYVFDETGHVQLPAVPTGDVRLVLRQPE